VADDETVLLARRDDAVVGFLTLDVWPDRTDVPVSRPFTHPSPVAVATPHRGEGVGTAPVCAALERRRTGETTRRPALGTWASNEGRRRPFERFGFETAARKPGHRADGDDSVSLVLPPEATPLSA
jgi:GNAT superfamily N-acetyltransferase